VGKLPQQGEFLEIIVAWEPIRPFMVNFVNHWLPWVELVFGVLLVTGTASRFTASLAAGLISGFIVNNLWMQSLGLGYASCGCFGVWERLLAGKISVTEAFYLDIVMLVLVSIILLFYPARFFGVYPWFLKKHRVSEGI
jgi:uncharacterized membrane protein YphA (DoxX/SURF4 family)